MSRPHDPATAWSQADILAYLRHQYHCWNTRAADAEEREGAVIALGSAIHEIESGEARKVIAAHAPEAKP